MTTQQLMTLRFDNVSDNKTLESKKVNKFNLNEGNEHTGQ